jgi:hypothetical protein
LKAVMEKAEANKSPEAETARIRFEYAKSRSEEREEERAAHRKTFHEKGEVGIRVRRIVAEDATWKGYFDQTPKVPWSLEP